MSKEPDQHWRLEPVPKAKLTPLQLAKLTAAFQHSAARMPPLDDDRAQLSAAIEKREGKAGITSSTQLKDLILTALDDATPNDALELITKVARLFKDYTGPEDAVAIEVRRIWKETEIDFLAGHLAKLKGEYQATNRTSIVVLAVSAGLAEKVRTNPDRLRLKVQGKDNVTKVEFEPVFVIA